MVHVHCRYLDDRRPRSGLKGPVQQSTQLLSWEHTSLGLNPQVETLVTSFSDPNGMRWCRIRTPELPCWQKKRLRFFQRDLCSAVKPICRSTRIMATSSPKWSSEMLTGTKQSAPSPDMSKHQITPDIRSLVLFYLHPIILGIRDSHPTLSGFLTFCFDLSRL